MRVLGSGTLAGTSAGLGAIVLTYRESVVTLVSGSKRQATAFADSALHSIHPSSCFIWKPFHRTPVGAQSSTSLKLRCHR